MRIVLLLAVLGASVALAIFLEPLETKIRIPIALSTLALGVSAYTLWAARLAPFRLSLATTGRAVLTNNPSYPGGRQVAVGLRLLFTNEGARHGYVRDLAVAMNRAGSDDAPLLLRSVYEQTDDTLNATRDLPPPKLTAFTSFAVKPGETVMKTVFFMPFDRHRDSAYQLAQYSFTPYSRVHHREWVAWKPITVAVSDEDLAALAKMTVTPDTDGGQFVKWIQHSKPTSEEDTALHLLKKRLRCGPGYGA